MNTVLLVILTLSLDASLLGKALPANDPGWIGLGSLRSSKQRVSTSSPNSSDYHCCQTLPSSASIAVRRRGHFEPRRFSCARVGSEARLIAVFARMVVQRVSMITLSETNSSRAGDR
jgi:hypothetical protein